MYTHIIYINISPYLKNTEMFAKYAQTHVTYSTFLGLCFVILWEHVVIWIAYSLFHVFKLN